MAAAIRASVLTVTCRPPARSTRRCPERARFEFEADQEQHHHHAEFGEMLELFGLGAHQPQCGPIRIPAAR